MTRARGVVLACLAATVLVAVVGLPRLGLNSNENALFAADVPYAALRRDFAAAFPSLVDPLIVILDAPDRETARTTSAQLRARLRKDPAQFPRVFDPGARDFFESRGLLYLETAEVEDTLDRLIRAQPFLAEYAADPSLRGFAELVARALEAKRAGEGELLEGLEAWIDALAASAETAGSETQKPLETEALFGAEAPDAKRRFLLVQPAVDHARLEPAAGTLRELHRHLEELGLRGEGPARAQVTGLYALSSEEAHLVKRQARLAGLASFVLVGILLLLGIGASRVVAWILLTLVVGLVWCAAFAAFAIGHLNLVSVAFGVLFIGLSVDFGIHFALRFQEVRASGKGESESLEETAQSVGASLAICALTTSLAFFAFVPTAFLGVAELGLIAGVGMLVSLALNLTLLPALFAGWGAPPRAPRPESSAPKGRRERWVAIAVAATAVAALPVLPALRFDTNPIGVRDPGAESVRAFEALLADGVAFPWNLNVLASDEDAAARAVAALRDDPTVGEVRWIEDLIPTDQDDKRGLLEEAAFVMGPALSPGPASPSSDAEDRAALRTLREASRGGGPAAARLGVALDRVLASTRDSGGGLPALRDLWVRPMNRDLERMRVALHPSRVDSSSLPPALREQWIAPDGRFRVEVFPREDLSDADALARFVAAVQRVDPDTFGEGRVIHESGKIVVQAFRHALVTAALGVLAVLLLLWRNGIDTVLVAVPIAFAAVLCAAGTVLLGIPLNYANIIVIPLLLGMGVDSGIHLVHRLRYEPRGISLLRTSTARAVVFSALTTLASFGTLAFTPHRGMASLGKLLALGIGMILLCNLSVLPALARWLRRAEPT